MTFEHQCAEKCGGGFITMDPCEQTIWTW